MAKLMKKDVERWNSECKNGFCFDIQYFLYHNEKTLIKDIELDKNNFIRAHLTFYNEYENFRAVGYYINCNISKWFHKENDNFSSSSGLGLNIKINDKMYEKRSFKELQKATEMLTNEYILELYNNDMKNNKIIERT